jgi:hypothetical protein
MFELCLEMKGYARLAGSDIELAPLGIVPRPLENPAEEGEDSGAATIMPTDSRVGEADCCTRARDEFCSVLCRWFPLLAYLGVTIFAVVLLRWMFYGTACTDTADWNNGHGLSCKMYSQLRYCEAGTVRWNSVSGRAFGDPHRNCCVCGKHTADANVSFEECFRGLCAGNG